MFEKQEMATLKKKLINLLVQEDLFWKQRAKQHCMWDGDRNTSFFDVATTQRRKRNQIKRLINDANVEVT